MTVFSRLQRDIERIYRLHAFAPIELFLINDRELRLNNPSVDARPQVLFQERDGEALLGVYFAEETKRKFEQSGPENSTLAEFCEVAEEISHFVYLSHCAKSEKKVSLLDLEVQAEIDKFLLAVHYRGNQKGLFETLFENVGFRDQPDTEERKRYEEANRLGAKVVKWLGSGLKNELLSKSALGFLRDFYRMGSFNKLNKVEKMRGI